jgi:hypothetical protein
VDAQPLVDPRVSIWRNILLWIGRGSALLNLPLIGQGIIAVGYIEQGCCYRDSTGMIG